MPQGNIGQRPVPWLFTAGVSFRAMNRSRLSLVLTLASGAGCSPRVDVGSSLRWFAQHETGDFTEWTADEKGHRPPTRLDTLVVISTDVAHSSGTHSVKLINAAPSVYETARGARTTTEAYYSAWF